MLPQRDDDALSRQLVAGLTEAMRGETSAARIAAAVLIIPCHLREWHLESFFASAMTAQHRDIMRERDNLQQILRDGGNAPTSIRIADGPRRLLAILASPWMPADGDPAEDHITGRALTLVRWQPSLLADPSALPAYRPEAAIGDRLAAIRALDRYSRLDPRALDPGDRKLEAYLADADVVVRREAACVLAQGPVSFETRFAPADVAARIAILERAAGDVDSLVATAARLARLRLLHAFDLRAPGPADLEWLLTRDDLAMRFAILDLLHESARRDDLSADLRERIEARLETEAQHP